VKPAHLILLLLFNVFWAVSLSAIQALKAHLDYGGIATLRFGGAAVSLMLVWPWLPGAGPRGRDLWKASLMGVIVFTLGHRLQVWGNLLGSAGNSSVLMAVEPLLTAVAAAVFLREHIAPQRWLGFSLGIVGVALLNRVWADDFKWAGLTASAVFIASFLSEAAYSIMGKPLLDRVGPMKILAVSLVAGTLANLAIDGPTTFKAAQLMPTSAWSWIAFLSLVCTSLGYGLWLVVIRETDVNLTAMTILMQPVAGVPVAVLWLGERLHAGHLWGSLAIVTGLVIGLYARPAEPSLSQTQ
jgi:drug/metabolite transporter (DMT)-like permease